MSEAPQPVRSRADDLWGLADLPFSGLDIPDAQTHRRYRMLGINAAVTIGLGLPLALVHVLAGDIWLAWALIAYDGLLTVNLLATRRHRNPELAGAVSSLLSVLILVAESLGQGGFMRPATGLLYMMPIIATLIASYRVGLGITVITMVTLVLIWVYGPSAPMSVGDSWLDLFLRLLTLVCFLVLGWMTSIEERSLRTLIRAAREAFASEQGHLQAAEDRLTKVEHVAALASLASSVAHEFNNPLAAAIGNVELALEANEAGDEARLEARLEDASAALTRAGQLVQALRGYSRVASDPAEASDLHEVIEAALGLVGNELRHRGRVEQRLEATAPRVRGAVGQWTQVVVHLLTNAARAIEVGDSARHTIRVRTEDTPSGGVSVVVEDTGHGIPSELRRRVFEPFFTTKPVGTGAGLGLFVAKNLVAHVGGRIEVAAGPAGRGTRVTMWLPRARG